MTNDDRFEIVLTELKAMALHMCAAPPSGAPLTARQANELVDRMLRLNQQTGRSLLLTVEALRMFR
jgi:hypothetical protein